MFCFPSFFLFVQPLQKYLAPVVAAGIHTEYRQLSAWGKMLSLILIPFFFFPRWVPFCIRQLARFVGVSIAFSVQRVISGFYSAVRGGQLFAVGLLQYLVHHNHIAATHEVWLLLLLLLFFVWKFNLSKTNRGFTYFAIMGVTVLLGFWFQLSTFFGLPFPLNLLMFPFTILENVLLYFVSSDVHTGASGVRS